MSYRAARASTENTLSLQTILRASTLIHPTFIVSTLYTDVANQCITVQPVTEQTSNKGREGY